MTIAFYLLLIEGRTLEQQVENMSDCKPESCSPLVRIEGMLATALAGISEQLGSIRREIGDLKANMGEARGEIKDLRGEVGQLRTGVTRLEQKTDQHDESVDKLGERINSLESKYNDLNARMVKYVGIATGISIAIGFAMKFIGK